MDPKVIPPLQVVPRYPEEEVKERVFISMTPVVDITFLDEKFVIDCLEDALLDIHESYVEWDTSWRGSFSSKALTDYLISKKVPANVKILLKLSD